jgi:TM2 domain-containing membrane protein YozV
MVAQSREAKSGFHNILILRRVQSMKSKTTTLIISLLLGELGIDRFYLGYTGLGILKLLTVGGCGIWYIIDIILILTDKMKDKNGNALEK